MVRRLAASLLLLFASTSRASAVYVAVSIAPLGGLVAEVMGDAGTLHVLVPAGASEHTHALRPSDAAALARADVVVWIGPDHERFMAESVANLPPSVRVLALAAEPGLTLLPARADDHDDHGGGVDGHLWLDPLNARAIVRLVADALAAADPASAATFAANAAAADARLAALDADLARAFAPIAGRPFVVFHDAYQYLERRYGLAAVGSIVLEPEHGASAGHLVELRERIRTSGAVCVFTEPQFDPGLPAALVEGTDARIGMLDHLGMSAAPGSYERTLRGLARSLIECLGQPVSGNP